MEIRGVWITNTASRFFSSRQTIAEGIALLADTGFNSIFPVVWNKSYTLYPSRMMAEFGSEIDPTLRGRDPLAEVIEEAQKYNLQVIPWFEYGFASSYNQNGGRLLERKPEWSARDRNGHLLKKNNFEWMNAFLPDVQNFLLGLILEVAKNYPIAGIQGDDRLPALPSEGGYDPYTVQLYRQAFNQDPPQNSKDPQWLQWRANLLTDFLSRLYQQVKAINPNLLVSLSPSPYDWGYREYLQDLRTWCDRKLVDIIHPQLYFRDFRGYRRALDRALHQQFNFEQKSILFPGVLMKVGDYRISPRTLIQILEYNRSCGLKGEVFFFYEGLREENNALTKVLKDSLYAHPA